MSFRLKCYVIIILFLATRVITAVHYNVNIGRDSLVHNVLSQEVRKCLRNPPILYNEVRQRVRPCSGSTAYILTQWALVIGSTLSRGSRGTALAAFARSGCSGMALWLFARARDAMDLPVDSLLAAVEGPWSCQRTYLSNDLHLSKMALAWHVALIALAGPQHGLPGRLLLLLLHGSWLLLLAWLMALTAVARPMALTATPCGVKNVRA